MEADALSRRTAGIASLALAVALASACASPGTWVPFCEGDSFLSPSKECAAEAVPTRAQLAELIEGTGTLLVRVGFGSAGEVDSVCAVRSGVPRQRDAILALNAVLAEIRQTPAGPACLAGTSFELNHSGAAVGSLRANLRDCNAEAVSGSTRNLSDRACLESRQVQRGELWFFGSRQDVPYVFQPGAADATARNVALDRCSDDDATLVPTRPDQIKIGNTRNIERLTACMAQLGWRRTI